MIAVPVSLIGTFALFPTSWFLYQYQSRSFGWCVAIGLVVDDAIVVVEAVQRHIEEGMTPREASLKAMEEVAAPVAAIALVLAAVFLPTVFIPGITGATLYTVCNNYRYFGAPLCLQRLDIEPSALAQSCCVQRRRRAARWAGFSAGSIVLSDVRPKAISVCPALSFERQ